MILDSLGQPISKDDIVATFNDRRIKLYVVEEVNNGLVKLLSVETIGRPIADCVDRRYLVVVTQQFEKTSD